MLWICFTFFSVELQLITFSLDICPELLISGGNVFWWYCLLVVAVYVAQFCTEISLQCLGLTIGWMQFFYGIWNAAILLIGWAASWVLVLGLEHWIHHHKQYKDVIAMVYTVINFVPNISWFWFCIFEPMIIGCMFI